MSESRANALGIDAKVARKLLPSRPKRGNKSTHGRALIFAGSDRYPGAALLAANAAGRVGAGYVMIASRGSTNEIIKTNPEFLVVNSDDEDLLENSKATAVAIGPGFGTGEETRTWLERLIDEKFERVVVDADALTTLAGLKISKLPRSWVLTPHTGELGRLIEMKPDEIESDRFRAAEMAAKKFGCLILLKGFRTILSNGERNWVILSGNSALGKAGSGDVLTGMIVGLAAQATASMASAAALGAFLHGKIADEWVMSGRDKASMLPSDLANMLPQLIYRVRRGIET